MILSLYLRNQRHQEKRVLPSLNFPITVHYNVIFLFILLLVANLWRTAPWGIKESLQSIPEALLNYIVSENWINGFSQVLLNSFQRHVGTIVTFTMYTGVACTLHNSEGSIQISVNIQKTQAVPNVSRHKVAVIHDIQLYLKAILSYYVLFSIIGYLSYNYYPVSSYDFLKKMSLNKRDHF